MLPQEILKISPPGEIKNISELRIFLVNKKILRSFVCPVDIENISWGGVGWGTGGRLWDQRSTADTVAFPDTPSRCGKARDKAGIMLNKE